MSDLSSLVSGLSDGLNAYLQQGNQIKMKQAVTDANQAAILQREEQLAKYKSGLDADNSQFTSDMAESAVPGAGAVIKSFAASNGGRNPSFDQGMKLLNAYPQASIGGSNNKVSGKTMATLLSQMGADPEDVTAVGKLDFLPTGLAEAFTSKVFKKGEMTPPQMEMSYRAINPYMANKDSDMLKQDPNFNSFSANMTSDGTKTIDPSEFPALAQNADAYTKQRMEAYQKQGLNEADAYSKALTDASQVAAPYSRKIKRQLLNHVHLTVLQSGNK